MNNILALLLEVVGVVQAIVAAPTIPLVVAEVISLTSQLTTPDQQMAFLGAVIAWARSCPPYSGATDTDEARTAAGFISAALNQIADDVRRGNGTGGEATA